MDSRVAAAVTSCKGCASSEDRRPRRALASLMDLLGNRQGSCQVGSRIVTVLGCKSIAYCPPAKMPSLTVIIMFSGTEFGKKRKETKKKTTKSQQWILQVGFGEMSKAQQCVATNQYVPDLHP